MNRHREKIFDQIEIIFYAKIDLSILFFSSISLIASWQVRGNKRREGYGRIKSFSPKSRGILGFFSSQNFVIIIVSHRVQFR
jgi:hypothetical protein